MPGMARTRERSEDIQILAEYCASQCARKMGKTVRVIDESAMAALRAFSWAGNIRELQNVVERAVILARGRVLGVSDFELPGLGSAPPQPHALFRRTSANGSKRRSRSVAAGCRASRVRRSCSASRPLPSTRRFAGSGSTSTRSAGAGPPDDARPIARRSDGPASTFRGAVVVVAQRRRRRPLPAPVEVPTVEADDLRDLDSRRRTTSPQPGDKMPFSVGARLPRARPLAGNRES